MRRLFRMHRVPTSLLRQHAGADLKQREELTALLVKRYGFRLALAEALAATPVSDRSDLLRNDALLERASKEELLILLQPPRDDQWRSGSGRVLESTSRVHRETGYSLVWRRIAEPGRGEVRRLAIEDGSGELMSGELDPELFPSIPSLRYFGYYTPELLALDHATKTRLFRRLRAVNVPRTRGLLDGEGFSEAPLPEDYGFRILAGFLLAARAFTGHSAMEDGELAGGAVVSPPGGSTGLTGQPVETPKDQETECRELIAQNGCGPEGLAKLSEELAKRASQLGQVLGIDDCCNRHDLCYCLDCSACQRLDCDNALHDCILAKTNNPPLAASMYALVRTFGVLTDDTPCTTKGVGAAATVAAGVAAGWAVGSAVGEVFGPEAGIAVGILVGLAVTRWLGKLFCELCELVTGWEQSVEEWLDGRWEKIKRRHEHKIKKCKKKKRWWQRLWCKIKTVVETFVELLWWLVVVIVDVILTLVSWLVCG